MSRRTRYLSDADILSQVNVEATKERVFVYQLEDACRVNTLSHVGPRSGGVIIFRPRSPLHWHANLNSCWDKL